MEKIYMIPVNDAYNEEGGCPVCRLRDKSEFNYLEYYLGPSLMEPDTRKITNKTGFCPVHMGKLNQSVTNRLGLGLMMHPEHSPCRDRSAQRDRCRSRRFSRP